MYSGSYLGSKQCCNTNNGGGSQGPKGPTGPTGDSYWNPDTITVTTAGTPNGYTGIGYTGDVLVHGNLYVKGKIDPTFVIFTPQPTNSDLTSIPRNSIWFDDAVVPQMRIVNATALFSNSVGFDRLRLTSNSIGNVNSGVLDVGNPGHLFLAASGVNPDGPTGSTGHTGSTGSTGHTGYTGILGVIHLLSPTLFSYVPVCINPPILPSNLVNKTYVDAHVSALNDQISALNDQIAMLLNLIQNP